MAARARYQEKLDEIRNDVIRMGTDALDMIRTATEAMIAGDVHLAQSVIAADDSIDAQERSIYTKAVVVVMQEAPVASDLRLLVSTLGMVGEIEKAADDAVKLSRRTTKLQHEFPAEMRRPLMDLSERVRRQFSAALRLYGEYSHELAREVIDLDDEIDDHYSQARKDIAARISTSPEQSDSLLRCIEVFHALEHVGDHAVEIARRLRMLYEV